jgi:hypothetical protein
MKYLYLVMTGELGDGEVLYEPVAVYATLSHANRKVRKAKREDEYQHQYDKVERVPFEPD